MLFIAPTSRPLGIALIDVRFITHAHKRSRREIFSYFTVLLDLYVLGITSVAVQRMRYGQVVIGPAGSGKVSKH